MNQNVRVNLTYIINVNFIEEIKKTIKKKIKKKEKQLRRNKKTIFTNYF